jgi:hypothetical protein
MSIVSSVSWLATLFRRQGVRSRDRAQERRESPVVDVEELIARAGGRVTGDLPGSGPVSAARSRAGRPAWVRRLSPPSEDLRDQD